MYKYIKISASVTKPDVVVIKSLKSSAAGKLTARISEQPDVDGFEIVYSTNSKFTSNTTKKVTVAKTTYTLTKLKSSKKYYIKIRAYVVDESGNKIYGSYNKVKSVTVK